MIPWRIPKTSSRYKKLSRQGTNHIVRSDYNFLRWWSLSMEHYTHSIIVLLLQRHRYIHLDRVQVVLEPKFILSQRQMFHRALGSAKTIGPKMSEVSFVFRFLKDLIWTDQEFDKTLNNGLKLLNNFALFTKAYEICQIRLKQGFKYSAYWNSPRFWTRKKDANEYFDYFLLCTKIQCD